MATSPKAVQKAPPKAEEPVEELAPPKSSGKKKIIITSLVLLLLGMAGLGVFFFMDNQKDTPPASADGSAAAEQTAPQEAPKPPVFITLEPFTVNLQPDGAGDQFMQVQFTLQVADQTQVDAIKLYMPQVRSRLLMLLSSKRASEISTPEGKKKLSEEIIAQVKQPFNAQSRPQAVSNVFFTSFVIQ
jgi:flagellar FliL protein